MVARDKLNLLKDKFGPAILRADLPADERLFVSVDPAAMRDICRYVFRRPRRALRHQHWRGRPAVLGRIPGRAQFRF